MREANLGRQDMNADNAVEGQCRSRCGERRCACRAAPGQADDAVAMATSAAIAVINLFGGTGGQGGCDENRPRCGFMNDGGNGLAAFLVVFRAGLGCPMVEIVRAKSAAAASPARRNT
jgi:hypothetical protein